MNFWYVNTFAFHWGSTWQCKDITSNMHFSSFTCCVRGGEKTIPLKNDTYRGWSGMKCLRSIDERWMVGSNRSGGEAFAIHSLTMDAISEYRLLHAHSTRGSEFVCMYVNTWNSREACVACLLLDLATITGIVSREVVRICYNKRELRMIATLSRPDFC